MDDISSLGIDEVLGLFEYSLKEMGIATKLVTKIMFRYIAFNL